MFSAVRPLGRFARLVSFHSSAFSLPGRSRSYHLPLPWLPPKSPTPTLPTPTLTPPSRCRLCSHCAGAAYPPPPRVQRPEVCRDFLRYRCTRPDIEGKYAHPHHSVSVQRDNKVTVCADLLRKNFFRGGSVATTTRLLRSRMITADSRNILLRHFYQKSDEKLRPKRAASDNLTPQNNCKQPTGPVANCGSQSSSRS